MMWPIIESAVALFDTYIIVTFYRKQFPQRVPKRMITMITLGCVMFRFIVHLYEIPLPLLILYSVAVCFGMTLVYKATWKQRLFYPMMIVSLEIIAEIAAGIMIGLLFMKPVNEIIDSPHNTLYLIDSQDVSKITTFFDSIEFLAS